MLRTMMSSLAAAAAMALTAPAVALNIFACEPEWGALAKELAGDQANVYTATTALQDVHRVEARPSLIAAARRADLLVCTGADLEAAWLPVLTRESGNAKIQPGTVGHFEATSAATLAEVPTRLDRFEGDIHAQGNPHIHTDPRNIAKVARALAERLAAIDPSNAELYRTRHRAFAERWQGAIAKWERAGALLRGVPAVEHHRAFSYLFRWLGVEVLGYLEPKPGLEPTIGHMSQLLAQQQTRPAKMVVRASYNDPRAAAWFAERAKVPGVVLPFSVGGDAASKDLFSWYDAMLDALLKAAQ